MFCQWVLTIFCPFSVSLNPHKNSNPRNPSIQAVFGDSWYCFYLFFFFTVLNTNRTRYTTIPMPSGYKICCDAEKRYPLPFIHVLQMKSNKFHAPIHITINETPPNNVLMALFIFCSFTYTSSSLSGFRRFSLYIPSQLLIFYHLSAYFSSDFSEHKTDSLGKCCLRLP